MSQKVGTAVLELTTDNAQLVKGLSEAGRTTQSFGNYLGPLKNQILGAFSATAVIAFGKEVLDTADTLVKLSDQTGIGVEQIQALKYIAEQSGNTFEQIAAAVSMMQKRIAGGDDSALGALTQLGLSQAAFMAMTPDQQFLAIAREIAKIEDPLQRVKLATDLFGRSGAEILPSLIADVDALAEQAPKMSAKAAQAFDAVGDAMNTAWSKTKNAVGEGLAAMGDAYSRLARGAQSLWAGDFSRAIDVFADLNTQVPKTESAFKGLADRGIKPLTVTEAEATRISKDLTAQLKDQEKQHAAAEEAARKQAAQQKAQNELWAARTSGLQTVRGVTAALDAAEAHQTDTAEQLANAYTLLSTEIDFFGDSLAANIARTTEANQRLRTLTGSAKSLADGLPDVRSTLDETTKTTKSGESAWSKYGDAAMEMFDGLSRTAEMAGHATTAAVMSIASTTIKAFATGGPVAGVIAGITSAFAALGNKIFKTEGRKVNDMRDEFVAAAGGLDQLNQKAHDAGMTLDALLRADTVKEYEAAVKALNAAFDAQQQKLQAIADTKAELADYEQQLADLQASSVPVWGRIQEIVDEFGLSVDALGPAINQIKINEFARRYIDAFDYMKAANADVNGLLAGMADEISALVQDSMKFGTAIPENMRPMIEQLFLNGQLLDGNKQKILDISGLKWGAPVKSEADIFKEAVQKLIDKIGELTDRLTGLVNPSGAAIDTIRGQWSKEPWADWQMPRWPSGEPGEMPGALPMADGFVGTVTRPTLFLAGEAGTEDVAFSGGGRSFGQRPIEITVISQLDGREVARNQIRHLPWALDRMGLA